MRILPLIERVEETAEAEVLTNPYLDHVESDGRLLFEQIVAMDLEGIVCKRKDSPYKMTDKPSRHWIKVKNSRFSQVVIIVFAENFDTLSVC